MVTAAEKKKNEITKTIKTNEKKWGKTAMDAGWTAFPSIILEKQHALGLDALDVNIILYLSTYWWESENKPHPTKKTIAEAIGITPRTVQRRIASLEKAGFMKREYRPDKDKGNKSNKYHFDGLIKEIQPYAQEKINGIKERKSAEKARKTRKRPH
ncbi:MAG: MarR family transcriptional regulator [Gammaproteobacteria bacterium]|nr:MarR family transcriptional regulator [Gammaproteobacteria bacterium]